MPEFPVDTLRETFQKETVHGNLVVSAPTGSGKSTRIPLWCPRPVLVVEPRRIACRTLAGWVAHQLDQKPGQQVGYSVRFESRQSEQTDILFVTPGVALGYAATGELDRFATVVVDEFHERGVETDLFVPMVRRLHPEKLLVVMSATLDGHRLSQALEARWLRAEGRLFEVEVIYLGGCEVPSGKGLADRVASGVKRALAETDGNVLVFLPGMKAISEAAQRIRGAPVVKLHGSFSHQEQDRAFQSGPRQVILSTNVAESSVTVPGVTAVVDAGLVKQHLHRGGHSALATVPISNASAEQRRGRAGRLCPGRCYRLWSELAELPASTPPELLRIELTELALWTASVGLKSEELPFVDPPPAFALANAQARLTRWKALEEGKITDRGQRLVKLPLPAELAHLLVDAPAELLADLCDLCAVLEARSSLFLMTRDEEQLQHRKEELSGSGPVSSILALRRGEPQRHHLHPDALSQARKVAQQLRNLVSTRPLQEDREQTPAGKTLAAYLAQRWPERAYVKRKSREAWANGENEVRLARSTVLPEGTQAVIMLEIEPVAGKGLGIDLRGRDPLPTTFSTLLQAGLGEREVANPTIRDGLVTADVKITYGGRVLGRLSQQLEGSLLRRAGTELILAGKLLEPAGRELETAFFYWSLQQELAGDQPQQSATDWLLNRLAELGVERPEDLDLLEPTDLEFDRLQQWEKEKLEQQYPASFSSGSARFAVEYQPRLRKVVLHWQSGLKNAPLSQAMLPRWNGWRVQINERGRLTNVR